MEGRGEDLGRAQEGGAVVSSRDIGTSPHTLANFPPQLSPFVNSFSDITRSYKEKGKYEGLVIERGAAALFRCEARSRPSLATQPVGACSICHPLIY